MAVAATIDDPRHLGYPQVALAFVAYVGGGVLALRRSGRADGATAGLAGSLALALVIGLQLAVPVAWRLGVARIRRMLPEAPDVR